MYSELPGWMNFRWTCKYSNFSFKSYGFHWINYDCSKYSECRSIIYKSAKAEQAYWKFEVWVSTNYSHLSASILVRPVSRNVRVTCIYILQALSIKCWVIRRTQNPSCIWSQLLYGTGQSTSLLIVTAYHPYSSTRVDLILPGWFQMNKSDKLRASSFV